MSAALSWLLVCPCLTEWMLKTLCFSKMGKKYLGKVTKARSMNHVKEISSFFLYAPLRGPAHSLLYFVFQGSR